MPEPVLSPLERFVLAFYVFFAVLFRADVALAVKRIREARRTGALLPAPGEPRPSSHATVEPTYTTTGTTRPSSGPGRVEQGPAPAVEKKDPVPAAGSRPVPVDARTIAAPPAAPEPKPAAAKPAEAKGANGKPVEALRPVEIPKPAEPAKPVDVTKPVAPARAPEAKPVEPVPAAMPPRAPEPSRTPDTRAALQLLSVLQREGRLVDFIEEDLTGFPDAAIGAAARTVHAGCKKAIEELFRLEPVFREAEGAQVTVAAGFDPAAIRLTGNVMGKPPFRGALRHHGWRAREVKLPPPVDGKDPAILAPAEVEL
jgi:hypothetical protein